MVDNERLTVSKKEFFVRVLAVLNTSYVAVCALLNMNGSLSILGLSSKILMIILSIVGVGVLLVYYVNNRKQMDRSVKKQFALRDSPIKKERKRAEDRKSVV